jgi:hypothetical protein
MMKAALSLAGDGATGLQKPMDRVRSAFTCLSQGASIQRRSNSFRHSKATSVFYAESKE